MALPFAGYKTSNDARVKAIEDDYLKAADIIGDASLNNPDSPLYDKYVVFTGALEKFV